jgi:hypothetical protein
MPKLRNILASKARAADTAFKNTKVGKNLTSDAGRRVMKAGLEATSEMGKPMQDEPGHYHDASNHAPGVGQQLEPVKIRLRGTENAG